VLSWSYRTLSPGAARLFRLLGLHPGHDIDRPAAASLAGADLREAQTLLGELTRANLLSEHRPGRYTFHDLLRADAGERTRAEDGDDVRHAAVRRLIEHYVHTGQAAVLALDPRLEPITAEPVPAGVTLAAPATAGDGLAWFTTEHGTLLAAVRLAADTGLDAACWRLAWTLTTYLLRRGLWSDHTWAQETGLAAARRIGDPVGVANAVLSLALGYARAGRFGAAAPHFEHALTLFGELGDHTNQARVCDGLAWVAEHDDRLDDALVLVRRGLELFRAAGNESGQANSLNAIGWVLGKLGNYDEALVYCTEAIDLLQKMGNVYGLPPAWHSLGYIHARTGAHRRAIDCFRHALDGYRGLGDRYHEAVTLADLGDTLEAAGEAEAGRGARQQALEIWGELDHPDAGRVAAAAQRAEQRSDQREDQRR
jgi:tetratricopeptide (TPR) repeat protein